MNPDLQTSSQDQKKRRIAEAVEVLKGLSIGWRSLPQKDSGGLTLLALANLVPDLPWSEAQSPLRSLTEIMKFAEGIYGVRYAPNVRETLRYNVLKNMLQEGLIRCNPDDPERPSNSSKTVYQIEPHVLNLVRKFGTSEWEPSLKQFASLRNKSKDTAARNPEAFFLFNEPEGSVEEIAVEVQSRGIITFYFGKDVPIGADRRKLEAQTLREARVVVVFLGNEGWGRNHLRITREAMELRKRILPVLIGNPSKGELEEMKGLFRVGRYLDMRKVTADAIDLLAENIRRLPAEIESDSDVLSERVTNQDTDRILRVLIDGDDEECAIALEEIRSFSNSDKETLAVRLRTFITERFSPNRENEPSSSAFRTSDGERSIRVWMLSALIWVDANGLESRKCILNHLRNEYESDRFVRFWVLAVLYQSRASYLPEVAVVYRADAVREISALAQAILSPNDPEMHAQFREKLRTSDSEAAWPVLRALRVIPIPELAPDVCALLVVSKDGSSLAYDAICALTHPIVAQEAAKILAINPGVEEAVARIVSTAREAKKNTAKSFSVLLAALDVTRVNRAIEKAQRNPENGNAAQKLYKYLQDYRNRRDGQGEGIAKGVQNLTGLGSKREQTASGYTYGPAGYTSEFCGVGGTSPVSDHLGVEGMAHRLAELVALRETKLPLAIGLFGHWGSGKSHFMNLMDRHLKKLAKEKPEEWARRAAEPNAPLRLDPTEEGPWCREIVPIYFNAWHYIDTNLWASLVSHIFEGLFAYLSPKKSDLENVQRLLENATGAAARAAEDVAIAHSSTERAREELLLAETRRQNEQTAIDGLLYGLRSLLPEVKPAELQQHIVDVLDVGKEVQTLNDLRGVVRDAQKASGRVQTLCNAMWKQPGRGWRLAWLATAVVVVPSVSAIAVTYVPFVKEQLHKSSAALFSALSALVIWVRPIVGEAHRRLKQIEEWAKKAEAEQARAQETPQVFEAKNKMRSAISREESAKIRLAEAEIRERQLREEANSLAPERRLGRFIEQRAQSGDYRGQLGLVSLARRDFQELSDLFADKEALEKRIAKLEASQDPTKKMEAEQIAKLSKSIDRIVLFVDDLDRCQPEKVVEILQAVHLLLAFPLFAVVVGVDQRCLRQSLRIQFKGLLTPEQKNQDDHQYIRSVEEDEHPATPLDYLEKIFHVPFHLPTMEKLGYETLIDKLTEPAVNVVGNEASLMQEDKGVNDAHVGSVASGEKASAVSDVVGVDKKLIRPEIALTGEAAKNPVTNLAIGSSAQTNQTSNPASGEASLTPAAPKVIGSVPLRPWERTALKSFHMLIRTPRGATRLLNTYRLVRAGIPADEWEDFRGDESTQGEFRVAMLLLASAAGYPAVAREWFVRLRNMDTAALFRDKDIAETRRIDWVQFKKAYDAIFVDLASAPTRELFAKWLNRVERFAF